MKISLSVFITKNFIHSNEREKKLEQDNWFVVHLSSRYHLDTEIIGRENVEEHHQKIGYQEILKYLNSDSTH